MKFSGRGLFFPSKLCMICCSVLVKGITEEIVWDYYYRLMRRELLLAAGKKRKKSCDEDDR